MKNSEKITYEHMKTKTTLALINMTKDGRKNFYTDMELKMADKVLSERKLKK